jgi:hypothetical protein
MAEQPSTRVLPHELPASLREAGLDNWIREPLDDAVDRRRLVRPINDTYSFDPNVTVEFDGFADIVGRHFRQPAEGLGFDGSPVAHMWRTMIWPNNFL